MPYFIFRGIGRSLPENLSSSSWKFAMRQAWPALKYAFRRLTRSNPVGSVAVVLVLGLAIGATVSIFTLYDSVLLKPLPFAQGERLVQLYTVFSRSGMAFPRVALEHLQEFSESSKSFEGLAAAQHSRPILTGRGDPVRLRAVRVTSGFFQVLGIATAAGRTLADEDEGRRAAVLSLPLAVRLFGDRNEAVGQSLRLNEENYRVVGVLGRIHDYPPGTDLWLPFDPGHGAGLGVRLVGIGRLAAGVSREAAEQELSAILAGIREGIQARAVPLRDEQLV